MTKKHEPKIPFDATRDEKMKIIADEIYTCAEAWIRHAMETDSLLDEFVSRINSRNYQPIGLLRPRPL